MAHPETGLVLMLLNFVMFFSRINLDRINGCVHFGSRFIGLCSRSGIFMFSNFSFITRIGAVRGSADKVAWNVRGE